MSKRQKLTIVFSVILIAALVVLGIFLFPEGPEVGPGEEVGPYATSTEGGISGEGGVPEYTEEVDKRAEETKPEEVIEIVTNPERDESLGGYTITASRSGYSPEVLTVVQGNIVRLTFKSEGSKYDLFVPAMSVYLSAPEGGEKQTSFRVPQSGTFRFECRDFCPSGGKIYGQLIVKPKD